MKKSKYNITTVSYVLGILNAERTLDGCFRGITIQDCPGVKVEIIFVDGGSTDRTLEMISSFMETHKNVRLLHNPYKYSEGKGMSKDLGIAAATGEIVILLDHDNIITDKFWLKEILTPFKDENIMASQSLLKYRESDSHFIKYINAVGVDDPFAVPFSLVAQAQINPSQFILEKNSYFFYRTGKNKKFFGGANGCAFRRSVFKEIGGYTRDVDVFSRMAEKEMVVAIPLRARLHHDTANNLGNFMVKKGIYFYRFINKEYSEKSFKWVDSGFSNYVRFFLMVFLNLSFVNAFILSFKMYLRDRKIFWFLHPFFLFYITLEYGLITLGKIKNFLKYAEI